MSRPSQGQPRYAGADVSRRMRIAIRACVRMLLQYLIRLHQTRSSLDKRQYCTTTTTTIIPTTTTTTIGYYEYMTK